MFNAHVEPEHNVRFTAVASQFGSEETHSGVVYIKFTSCTQIGC